MTYTFFIIKPKSKDHEWSMGATVEEIIVRKRDNQYYLGGNVWEEYIVDKIFWDFQFPHLYSTREKAVEAFSKSMQSLINNWFLLVDVKQKEIISLKKDILKLKEAQKIFISENLIENNSSLN